MRPVLPPPEGPNPIDAHVGARILIRRKVAGISQAELASSLGLTFQQVQKYERGANRVSASKLYEIARILRTSITYFFEGLAEDASSGGGGEFLTPKRMRELAMSPQGLELARSFSQLRQAAVRRHVLALVRVLAEGEPSGDPGAGKSEA